MTTQPDFSPRPISDGFACIVVAASAAILSACASTGPPGVPGLDDNLQSSEYLLEKATYRFSFSVHAVRRAPVPGSFPANYPLENYERDIVGLISIADTQVLEFQTGERLLEGGKPCRIDVAGRLERGDSELEVQCADVRLKLHQLNGVIVDGTGFAWVLTDQGSESCITPTGRNWCLLRQRQGRAPMVTEYSWRSGPLRLERVAEPGGALD